MRLCSEKQIEHLGSPGINREISAVEEQVVAEAGQEVSWSGDLGIGTICFVSLNLF